MAVLPTSAAWFFSLWQDWVTIYIMETLETAKFALKCGSFEHYIVYEQKLIEDADQLKATINWARGALIEEDNRIRYLVIINSILGIIY